MDWCAWLSKSGLEPSLVHEYALLFFDNELEEDDIAHLDHAFLQSMGVSVAKHRLEILKLAGSQGRRKRWRRRRIPSPLAAVIKNCLARYVAALSCSGGVSAAVLAPLGSASPGSGGECRWGGGVASRRKAKLALLRQGRLVITDRGVNVVAHASPPRLLSASASASPMVARGCRENGGGGGYSETGGDGGIRWEAMFQNLKPT